MDIDKAPQPAKKPSTIMVTVIKGCLRTKDGTFCPGEKVAVSRSTAKRLRARGVVK